MPELFILVSLINDTFTYVLNPGNRGEITFQVILGFVLGIIFLNYTIFSYYILETIQDYNRRSMEVG